MESWVLESSNGWYIFGLLMVVIVLIIFGIDQYKVHNNVSDENGASVDETMFGEDPFTGEILSLEENKPDFLTDECGEYDDQAELLAAYIKLGAKEELSVEEMYEYMLLSEQLARNYVCVGYPEI